MAPRDSCKKIHQAIGQLIQQSITTNWKELLKIVPEPKKFGDVVI